MQAGEEFFDGPAKPNDSEIPIWLEQVVDSIVQGIDYSEELGPLNVRFQHIESDGIWQGTLFQMPAQLVGGGAIDGSVIYPDFSVDVRCLDDAFDAIRDVTFLTSTDLNPQPHLAIRGVIAGDSVVILILSSAPVDEMPVQKFDVESIE